jgi:hypothetical protein
MRLVFDFDRLRSGPFEGPATGKASGSAGGYLLLALRQYGQVLDQAEVGAPGH